MNINPHHLELFYHVACHGGLSEAARKMPYGIQPSAISRQLCQLERAMELTLYERRPFKLTPAGDEIFNLIRPTFAELPSLIRRLRHSAPEMIRLGASAVVVRDYLPPILPTLQQKFQALQLVVNEGLQGQIDLWLKEKALDLAVTVLEGAPPNGYVSEPLLRLPMILVVPAQSAVRSASQLWRQPQIQEKLITPSNSDSISRVFREGLQQRGVRWSLGLEANSIDLVETYVAKGLGYGVSVALPGRQISPALRALPLPNFPRIVVGIIRRHSLNTAAQALLAEFRLVARQLTPSVWHTS